MPTYRFTVPDDVSFDDVRDTLRLARIAVASAYGESRTILETHYDEDESKSTIAIDAANELGETLNRVFIGYLIREFPGACFEVQRREGHLSEPAE